MAGNVIPKGELAGCRPWTPGSFDRQHTQKPVAASEKPAKRENDPVSVQTASIALPTADDITKIYEETRAEAYRAGFDEGHQAGEASRRELIAEEMQNLGALLGNLQVSLAHLDQTVADQLLDLALEIATQVIRGSIAVQRDVLLPVIREAINALPLHHAHIIIYLHPKDAALVREQIGEQLGQTGTQIVDDPNLTPGGCTLKAGTSEIDATMETRWKRVLEALGVTPTAWLTTH